jgi:hypothetical protein
MPSEDQFTIHHAMPNSGLTIDANPSLIASPATSTDHYISLEFERHPTTNAINNVCFYTHTLRPTELTPTPSALLLRNDEHHYIELVLKHLRKELLRVVPGTAGSNSVEWIVDATQWKLNDHAAAMDEIEARLRREAGEEVKDGKTREVRQITGLLEMLRVENEEEATRGIEELMESLKL